MWAYYGYTETEKLQNKSHMNDTFLLLLCDIEKKKSWNKKGITFLKETIFTSPKGFKRIEFLPALG